MKSLQYIFAGFFGVLVVAAALYGTVRLAPKFMNRFASPSPAPSVSPTPSPTPKPYVPAKTYSPKGSVKGVTTTMTTTTTSHLTLTLVKTSDCNQSYMTEVRDITGPLALKYVLKDGYSANVTAWKQNGEEVVAQTQISSSGTLKTISGLTYLKVQTQPASCSSTSDTWLTLTAER